MIACAIIAVISPETILLVFRAALSQSRFIF
jgi:hypothetical protein